MVEDLERAVLTELWALRKDFIEADIAYAVTKARPEERYTLGPFYIPNVVDAHGEWTDAEELQKALWGYARKGNRDIMLQHSATKAGEWVELMSWPQETSVDLFLPDGAFSKARMRKATFPAGTAYIGVVWEPWAWELVKDGKVRGMSMGGRSGRVAVEFDQASMTKYNHVHDPLSGEFGSGLDGGRMATGGLSTLFGAPGISGYGGSPDIHTPGTPRGPAFGVVGTPFDEDSLTSSLSDLHDEMTNAGFTASGDGRFVNSSGESISVSKMDGMTSGIIVSEYDAKGDVQHSEVLRSPQEVASSHLMGRLYVEQSLNDVMATGGITKAKVSEFLDRLWAFADRPMAKYNHFHDPHSGEFASGPGGGAGPASRGVSSGGSGAAPAGVSAKFLADVDSVDSDGYPPPQVAKTYAQARVAPVSKADLDLAAPNAQRLLSQAAAARPGVERGVRGAAKAAGGNVEPTAHALKDPASLTRKIASDREMKRVSVDEATAAIGDSLRFSVLLDNASFTSGAHSALAQMRTSGYEPVTAKPFFDTSKSAYVGYNTTWRDPNTGLVFELQMHTPETAYFARKVIHPYFGAYRVADSQPGDAEMKQGATEKMTRLASLVSIPPGAQGLPAYDNRVPASAWPRGATVENMPHALTTHNVTAVTQADSHGFEPGDPRNGDPQLAARVANIEALQKQYLDAGRATDVLYEHNPAYPGRYTRFREAVHKQVIRKRMAAAADVPNNREAVIFGGIPGAGKGYAASTLGPKALGFDPAKFMTVNPDDMKAALVAVDPNDYQGLQPGETSPLLHEEGSRLAKDLAKEGMKQGKNILWDITMSSPGSVESRIKDLRAAGYEVKFAFVQAPPMAAASRAVHRWLTPGAEGRYVSIDQYRDLARAEATTGKTPNRATFDALKDSVDGWVLIDSSAGKPRVVGRG